MKIRLFLIANSIPVIWGKLSRKENMSMRYIPALIPLWVQKKRVTLKAGSTLRSKVFRGIKKLDLTFTKFICYNVYTRFFYFLKLTE